MFRTGDVLEACEVLQAKDIRETSTWTVKCRAQVDKAELSIAFKALDGKRLANELTAAWLGRQLAWGSVAEAMLISDECGEVGRLVGSEYPCARFVRGLGTPFSPLKAVAAPMLEDMQTLSSKTEFHRLVVFDVLIANTDRVNRNVFENGSFFVFDHDKAFMGETWTSKSLANGSTVVPCTIFESYLAQASASSLQAVRDCATSWGAELQTLDTGPLGELSDLGALQLEDVAALADFIVARAEILPQLVDQVIKRNC